nr:molybdate ABC transporter substrate-binding protein [Bacillus sp. T3]
MILLQKRFLILLFIFVFTLTVIGCSNDESNKQEATIKQVDLTISAAASLQDALNEIKAKYEKEHSNVNITYNFGGSGALYQQIIQGAPVDLFFSAAKDQFDLLVNDGFIEKNQSKDLIGNELVLIIPKGAQTGIQSFQDIEKAEKISIGIPETVPAGKYAKETLVNLDIWKRVESKLVFAKDVRQVLTYVETGNVDAGMVYKTDALTSNKVKVMTTAQNNLHSPIVYPVGILKKTANPEEALNFFEYLQTQESMKILYKYGFKNL